MKTKLLSVLSVIVVSAIGLLPANSMAGDSASANGKYNTLVQKLTCVADGARYGGYSDYGYWGGGPWCGQEGKAGYWVWVTPNWYIWGTEE